MVRYSLRCDQGHAFESWFASAEAFDGLAAGGRLACALCGSGTVEKALMAPALRTEGPAPSLAGALSTPRDPREEALARMRRHVEETSDYVGRSFAAEARRLHEDALSGGKAPERSIWGEARPEEARALAEDGIPVAALPFVPKRQVN